MKSPKSLLVILVALEVFSLTSCAGPGHSRLAKLAYLATPQTVSVGIILPENHIRTETALITLSGSWQLRPSILPVAQPSLR